MLKIQKNTKGFTVVEGLLIVLVVAVICFGGYYVWHTQHKSKTAKTTATSVKPTTPAKASTTTPKQPASPYAGWKSYTIKYEKLTFQYPAAWTLQDSSATQGLTPNADSITLTASDGFQVSIDDGWDGGGDPLDVDVNNKIPVTFVGNADYLVFLHPKIIGPQATGPDQHSTNVGSALLMSSPSTQYTKNNFPQDKNAQGDPNVNNGGSTMLISGGYSGSNAKTFVSAAQAASDPEFKNFVLVLQSTHY
jgi:hypothetical protein